MLQIIFYYILTFVGIVAITAVLVMIFMLIQTIHETIMTQETTITELCPYCEQEVELEAEFHVQVCPNCGEYIMPCSQCETCMDVCPLSEELRAKRQYDGRE